MLHIILLYPVTLPQKPAHQILQNSSVLQTQGVKLQDTGNQYTSVAEPEPTQSRILDIRLFPDRISSRISGLSNPVLDIEKDYPATEPNTVSAQLDIWCISNF